MQKRDPINYGPLFAGIGLSVAAHAAVFCYHPESVDRLPRMEMEQGHTVVQLTLVPSITQHPQNVDEASSFVAQEELPVVMQAESAAVELPEPEKIEPDPVPETAPLPEPAPPEDPPPAPPTHQPVAQESVEQIASLLLQKGVTADARPAHSFRPQYPRISQRRGEVGTVELSVQVDANGAVEAVQVVRSSGFDRLDRAAEEAAHKSRFVPAMRNGVAVGATLELSYTFRLTDE